MDSITIPVCTCLADIMVPSLELPEYMYELRNIADNICRERCKHSELHPDPHFTTHTEAGPSYKVAEDEECVDPQVDAAPATDVPSQAPDSHVGPAFHIPMTQEKSLQDLPSQLDFDWQDSATPCPMSATTAARNLAEELDVVRTPAVAASPTHVQVDTFVEVSQIAQETVMDSAVQEAVMDSAVEETGDPNVTTTSIADAPLD